MSLELPELIFQRRIQRRSQPVLLTPVTQDEYYPYDQFSTFNIRLWVHAIDARCMISALLQILRKGKTETK